MSSTTKTEYSLKERAVLVNSEKKLIVLTKIIMSCIAVLTTLVYVVSMMYAKFGGFTISVNKYNYVEYGLALSETRDFTSPTSNLNCKQFELITNIDGKSLDNANLGAIDGVDNGDNYMCYTFYLMNSGTEKVSYECIMNIADMTLDIEKAVRIRQIKSLNGGDKTITDFARVSSTQDDNGEYLPEEGTVPFSTKTTVFSQNEFDFEPGDVMKYTIALWLEGPDPDCVDSIIGGEFKVDIKFNILN